MVAENFSHLNAYTTCRVLESTIPESCGHDEKSAWRFMCDSDSFEICIFCELNLHHFFPYCFHCVKVRILKIWLFHSFAMCPGWSPQF